MSLQIRQRHRRPIPTVPPFGRLHRGTVSADRYERSSPALAWNLFHRVTLHRVYFIRTSCEICLALRVTCAMNIHCLRPTAEALSLSLSLSLSLVSLTHSLTHTLSDYLSLCVRACLYLCKCLAEQLTNLWVNFNEVFSIMQVYLHNRQTAVQTAVQLHRQTPDTRIQSRSRGITGQRIYTKAAETAVGRE